MAAKYWIKLYHETLQDRKVARLSDRLWRRVIEFFLLAGTEDDGGYLPDIQVMAWELHQNTELLEAELSELADLGIVDRVGGRWWVVNFAKRQAPSTGAERVIEHRKRKRKEAKEKETKDQRTDIIDQDIQSTYRNVTSNVTDPVTSLQESYENDNETLQSHERGRNVGVTNRYPNVTQNSNETLHPNENGNETLQAAGETGKEKDQLIIRVLRVMDRWGEITGRGIPSDEDIRREEYFKPINNLLIRFDWDEVAAIQALIEHRQNMISADFTPFKPAPVVGSIVAELDKGQGKDEDPGNWMKNEKIQRLIERGAIKM